MSPLVVPPARGYPDWQRIDNYDTGTLFSHAGVVINPSFATPFIDVSRYGYLAGFDQSLSGEILANFLWAEDAAGTVTVGERQFVLSSLITAPAQYRLPNLGPFVRILWQSVPFNTNTTHSCVIFATNRIHPLEFIPGNPVLIDQQGTVTAGPGLINPFYPTDYYAGPIDIFAISAQAGNNIAIQSLTAGFTWDYIWQTSAAGPPGTVATAVTPSGAWRLVFNTAGNGVAGGYLTVVPSTSGAS